MTDHTQHGEGKIIAEYFGSFVGTFLDVGANDGRTFSNTYDLWNRGWTGTLIEPSPTAFAKLAAIHANSGCNLVNAAITKTEGWISFWDSGPHLNRGDSALLSTTVESETHKWRKAGTAFTKTTVRGITFDTFLFESPVKRFDFISIDCEGADWDVLVQMDLAELGCRFLCVETNSVDDDKFIRLVAPQGLRLVEKNYCNLMFAV